MSRRREKLEKGWKSLKQKVEKFVSSVQPGPSVIVLYMKEGSDAGVKFAGSPELSNFAESISKRFITEVIGTEEAAIKEAEKRDNNREAVCNLFPSEIKVRDLRTVISERVGKYVKEEMGFHGRGFYGNNDYRPPWWPETIAFQSPNDRRGNTSHLKHSELTQLLEKYQEYVSLHACNEEVDEQSYANSSPKESNTKRKPDEQPSVNSSPKESNTKRKPDEQQLPCSSSTETNTSKKAHEQNLESDHINDNLLRSLAQISIKELHQVAEKLLSALIKPPRMNPSAMPDNRFEVPQGYRAYASLEQGDCFYSSLSILLYGSSVGKDILRLGSGLFGIVY